MPVVDLRRIHVTACTDRLYFPFYRWCCYGRRSRNRQTVFQSGSSAGLCVSFLLMLSLMITNGFMASGLTQQFIIIPSGGQKDLGLGEARRTSVSVRPEGPQSRCGHEDLSVSGLKSRCWQGCIPPGGSGRDSGVLPFQLLGAARAPPSLPASASVLSPPPLTLTHLPPLYTPLVRTLYPSASSGTTPVSRHVT